MEELKHTIHNLKLLDACMTNPNVLIEIVIWSSCNYYLARWCWKTTITLPYFSYLEYWILKLLKSNTKKKTPDKKSLSLSQE